MQTTIYTYLQRYLLKIRVTSLHCTGYKKSLIQSNVNTYFQNSKYLPSANNFNRTKEVLTPYCNKDNKIVLKRSTKQYCLCSSLNPLKNYRLFILIKTFLDFNQAENLCKENSLLNKNSDQVLYFFKIKKISVSIVEDIAFDFYNQKALAQLSGYDFSHFTKIDKNPLKSFYNLYIYSYKKLILNKKKERELVYKTFSIAFPEVLTLVTNRVSNYEPILFHNMLIFIDNFFFNGLKYIEQKKLIKNTEYKILENLITILYDYQFHKKKPNKIAFKPFYKKIVYMANGFSFHYYLMRPLFALTRSDTFYICESLKLPIYPDQSNYKVDFLRNRVRKQILPAIRILLNPQFDTILCKFNESYV